jgi:hypothetical protein
MIVSKNEVINKAPVYAIFDVKLLCGFTVNHSNQLIFLLI